MITTFELARNLLNSECIFEFRDGGVTFEEPRSIVTLNRDGDIFTIGGYFPDEGVKNILHRDQAFQATVFINNESDMGSGLFELLQ